MRNPKFKQITPNYRKRVLEVVLRVGKKLNRYSLPFAVFAGMKIGSDDPFCVTFIERISGGEERWHAIGSIENIIVIVVVHTYRQDDSDEVIRIISARRATRHERKLYAQANG